MAGQDEVTLAINVDDSAALKSIKNLDKNLDGLTDTLKTVAAGFLAFEGFKLAAGIFKDAIGEAAEAEQNIRNLNIALANVGELSKENSQDVQDFANSIADVTTVTDDAALKLFTMATNVGLTKDQAKLATEAAINLSAATGKDLDASLKAVTDTLSGQEGKLGKVIPKLKSLTEEELKAGKGIDIVAAQFKGFAEAATNTFGGAATQAKNSFGELLETLGGIVVQNPVVVTAIKEITELLKSLNVLVGNGTDTMRDFISDGIILAVNAFGTLISVLRPVVFFLQDVFAIFPRMQKAIFDANTALLEFIDKGINGIVLGFKTIVSVFSSVANDILTLVTTLPGASEAFETLGVNVEGVQKTLTDLADSTFNDTIKGFSGLNDSIKESKEKSQEWADALEGAEGVATTVDITLENFEKTLGKTAAKLIVAKNSTVDLTAGLKNGVKPAKDLTYTLSELAKGSFEKLKGQLEAITEENNKVLLSAHQLVDVQNIKANDLAKNAEKELQYLKDTKKLTQAQYDEEIKVVQAFKDQADERQRLADIKIDRDTFTDIGNTIGQGIAKGAEGAKDVIIKLGGKFVDAIAPGFGGIAETFLGIFAQGPEATKKMVRAFVDAIPEIVVAIADAAPAFVEGLLDQLINKGGALKIAVSIFKAMISLATGGEVGKNMAKGFVDWVQVKLAPFFQTMAAVLSGGLSLVFNQAYNFFSTFSFNSAFSGVANFLSTFQFPKISIPSITIGTPPWLGQLNNFITNLFKTPFWIKQAENFINNLYNFKWPSFSVGSGSGGNGTLADIGSSIGLAGGGTIPGGFPNDSFGPVNLQSGEMVVPDKDVNRLNDFLNRQDSGNTLEIALLGKILSALSQPQTVQSSVNLNGKTLADIMLTLSRNNARLTA